MVTTYSPLTDVERIAMHYGISINEACEWLKYHTVDELLPERGAGIERAVAMPGLLNPRATIDEITPLGFKPGDKIDLRVKYTAANDEEIAWQTVAQVLDTSGKKLVQERQKMEAKSQSKDIHCDTGLKMPSTLTTLIVEIWGHPDYWETTKPDP